MKKQFSILTALFALLSVLALGGCVNQINPVERPETGISEGKGMVRIEAGTGGGDARTVIPAVNFHHYEYWFSNNGGAAVAHTGVGGVFELDPGNYTVTVKAFAGAGDTSPATQGTSASFSITLGVDSGSISVILTPVLGVGNGTLTYTVEYPDGAEAVSFTLTRVGGGETFDLKAAGTETATALTGTKAAVGAGYWLARISLRNGGVYAGKSEVVHIYTDTSTALSWTFDDDAFTAIPVINAADSGPGTLREALARAEAGLGGTIFISLPAGGNVITLTTPLPPITKNVTILGNGATLTQSGFTPGTGTSLLTINQAGAMVYISRLHFKGNGRTTDGGAIRNNGGEITLESCIFSKNGETSLGGAIYNNGASANLYILGCTFYQNLSSYRGGAIYNTGRVYLTGNLFFGNTSPAGMVYNNYASGTTTSLGYNVSDKASGGGTSSANGTGISGYTAAGNGTDVFSAALPLSPVTFKTVTGGAAIGRITSLPDGYPEADFFGTPITAPAAAGAVQAQTTAGYYLEYGVSNTAYGTVSPPSPGPNADGFYSSGNVSLTAASGVSGVTFSKWLVNGADIDNANPLTVTMDGHKTVQAVFVRNYTLTSTNDAGTGSFREALGQVGDGDTITLPAGGTITLASVLPHISKSITIEGNGATLTQSGFTPSQTSQLLRISTSGLNIKISRLHFKGGRSTSQGGAIYSISSITLESCIFTDNQKNGAVYFDGSGNRMIQGCTFYNNSLAISVGRSGTVTLTGNVFWGSTAASNKVVSSGGATITSWGFNVSESDAGTAAGAGSGFNNGGGDVFNAVAPISPVSLKPVTGGAAAGRITSRPANYPTTDFFGNPIPATSAAAGAVQALTPAGWYLDYGSNSKFARFMIKSGVWVGKHLSG
ncbi:hypothetical protein AGMMS49944_28200 [Spirochaetia bacterium]|nr:hypothetical protein AGMMS49944_28200 [Spirochaetia bacterium]